MSKSVDKRGVRDEDVFGYCTNKDGKVFITWHAKQVMILKDEAAKSFLKRLQSTDPYQAQFIMAKLTGNFKHGNERHDAY